MTVTITITITDASGAGEVSITGGGTPGSSTGGSESPVGPSAFLLHGGAGAGTGELTEAGGTDGPPPMELGALGLAGAAREQGDTDASLPEEQLVAGDAEASGQEQEPMPIEALQQETKPSRPGRKG